MATNWAGAMNQMMPPFRGEQSRVTSAFGMRIHPKTKDRRMHYGVDISYPSPQGGGPIYSPIAGRAEVIAGSFYNTVYVYDANGNEHGFLHMSAVTVTSGTRVSAGTQLGFEGGMGPVRGGGKSNDAYGKHLHYQIKQKGTAVDPVIWWNKGVDPGQTVPPNPQSPEQFVEKNIVASGGDMPSNGQPAPPPVGNSGEYAPRAAAKSRTSGAQIAVWTNRVPKHEPWPRVMMVDETTNAPSPDVEYNVNHKPQYDDDGSKDTSGQIGRVDGLDKYDRGEFWRR